MHFKKLTSMMLCTAMLAGMMSGCSSKTAQTETTVSAAVAATTASTASEVPAGNGSYTAGTYTGVSANGRGGEVKVEVTFSDTTITDIKVTEQKETEGLATPALEQIPQAIVATQSLGVDTISGATVTSNAIIEAVADAVTQAGGDAEALKLVQVSKELSTEIVDMDANLVIVGGGAAGIAAAVSAAYEGMTGIVLLEKEASLGGNAIRSGGFIENLAPTEDIAMKTNEGYTDTMEEMLAAGPQDDNEKEIWDQLTSDYEAYQASGSEYLFDSAAKLAVDYHRVEGAPVQAYLSYPDLVNSFDQWFTEEIGGKFAPMCGIVGYTWPRWTFVDGYEKGFGYFDFFQKYIDEKNLDITIMLDTPVTDLATNNQGAVTGVVANADDGTTYNITSENGVVLCTGGFAANGEMLVKYNTKWDNMTADVKSDNNPGNTGDGIVMAEKLGAQLADMDNIMMFPQGDFVNTGDITAVGIFNGSSNLFVNTDAKRFVDETLSRFDICKAVFSQKDPYYYIITDALNSGLKDADPAAIEKSIANGALFRGETIEELAKNMGVDEAELKASVDTYNESCKSFKDAEFGRTTYADGSEIVEAPFYATPRQPVAHITIGGIVTDDAGHVLNENGEAIEGLYAAGETAASYCGISAFAYGKSIAKDIAASTK